MHMLVLNIIFDCNYMVVCLQKVVFMRDSEDTKLQLLQSRNSTMLINAIEVCENCFKSEIALSSIDFNKG